MTDYATHCAWCHTALDGVYVEWFPAFVFDPTSTRYCSAACVTARREDLFSRTKDVGEKWPRFTAEIPPELAAMLDAAQRRALGVNVSSASRAGIVRAGLRMYLALFDPMPEPAVNGEASDVIDVLALEP